MQLDMKVKRGQILKELRKQKSLNQSALAEFMGVSVQAYQKYEYGTAEPTFDSLCKLADFYSVSTDYLLGREETPEKQNPIMQLSDIQLEQIFLKNYFNLISVQQRTKIWEEIEKNLRMQIANEEKEREIYISHTSEHDHQEKESDDEEEQQEIHLEVKNKKIVKETIKDKKSVP